MAPLYNRPDPDPRYGYPVTLTSPDGRLVKAFYLGHRIDPDGSEHYFFSSIDQTEMMLLNTIDSGKPGREFVLSLPSLEFCEFGEPPPENPKPDVIHFRDGIVIIDQGIVLELLQKAAGDYAPYRMDIAWHLGSKQPLYIQGYYMTQSEYGKVLLTNELKRLGLWELCYCKFYTTSRMPFSID